MRQTLLVLLTIIIQSIAVSQSPIVTDFKGTLRGDSTGSYPTILGGKSSLTFQGISGLKYKSLAGTKSIAFLESPTFSGIVTMGDLSISGHISGSPIFVSNTIVRGTLYALGSLMTGTMDTTTGEIYIADGTSEGFGTITVQGLSGSFPVWELPNHSGVIATTDVAGGGTGLTASGNNNNFILSDGNGFISTAIYDTLTRGGTFLGIAVPDSMLFFEAPYACTVISIRAIRIGGGTTTFNITKNGSSNLLSVNDSVRTSMTTMGTLQNNTLAANDLLRASIRSVSYTVTELYFQIIIRKQKFR